MISKAILSLSLATLSFSGCPPRQVMGSITPTPRVIEFEKPKMPKNIIFMVGDGMGITQITAGLYSNSNHLELERCTYSGFHKSNSGDYLTTDSAAGATAFSCGKKTYNGAIAMNMDKEAIPTILEEAESKGLATGLVVTSTITHATPAAFIAHAESRKMNKEIAAQFPDSGIDLFIGGGSNHFDERKDGRNIIKELEKKGYVIKSIKEESIEDLAIDPNHPFGYFTGWGGPKTYRQGRRYLPTAAQKAANYLDKRSEKGFFMMVEGSQIDWGGHANDSEYIIEEMLDFDATIGKILDFAEQDGETLVIITADHETGGYSILPSSKMNNLKTHFSTKHHTPTLIPVFAFGPGAEHFSGIFDNTDLYYKMVEAFGW